MEDTNVEFDIEELREFVSPAIFDFLSDTSMNTAPSDPELVSTTLPLDDHTLDGSSDAPPPLQELDAYVDALFVACSQQFEEEELRLQDAKRMKIDSDSTLNESSRKRAFAAAKSKEEIAKAKLSAIPDSTLMDTNYCARMWKQWCNHRHFVNGDVIPGLEEISMTELATHMTNFIFEVRKKSGEEFPPKSLYHIVCGIQRHIRMSRNSSFDIFNDSKFADFRVCLDAEMKRLQKAGHGSRIRKAEPLTMEEEEILWQKGLLGKSNPQALVDTMLVLNGIYFALRSGKEHRQLRYDPCQITLHERPGSRPYLEYIEDVSKNRSGGLKGRKIQAKVVQHHNNPENPDRCFVELFKLYQSLCPIDRPKDAFYLQPLLKPTSTCWFSNKPIGHNKLEGTMARLCKTAQIPGYRTNHSLRATAATRLYNAGVEEQQVMERTGHSSLEGVRSYKRTSMQQKEALSDILNCQAKKNILSDSCSLADVALAPDVVTEQSVNLSSCSNVNASQSLAMTSASPSMFNFQSCSVTINVNK